MIENRICPFCNKPLIYWPNCSPRTNPDYYELSYSVFGRGKGAIKQYFHNSCYEMYVKKGVITNERKTES